MTLMIRKALTLAEAREIAAELRATVCRGTDWRVSIERPLFPGDFHLVVVG